MTGMSFEHADQAREFLFTIIESLPNGIILANSDGRVIVMNRKAAEILGVLGTSIQMLSSWELLRSCLDLSENDLAVLQNAGGRVLCQTKNRKAEAKKRYINIARTELKSPFWQISGFFITLEDITYLSMAAAQLDRKKRLDAMREMAAGMSQELKNPLGSLELYASILKRELESDPDNERVAGQMQQAVKSMDLILNNYVTFSSLPKPELDRLNIKKWLADSLGAVEVMAQGKIEFNCIFNHLDDDMIGDISLLKQLAVNACVNALESMPAGGVIHIETTTVLPEGQNNSYFELRIVDQGEGIEPENLERIFDPFFTTRGSSGGLGLATAHYITDVHQGFISVDSKVGMGTTLTVLLPLGEKFLS